MIIKLATLTIQVGISPLKEENKPLKAKQKELRAIMRR